jgi:hypothetical protein
MHVFPNIRYGTDRYPDRVARRLRVVNIVAWGAAAITTFFAVLRFFDPAPGCRHSPPSTRRPPSSSPPCHCFTG